MRKWQFGLMVAVFVLVCAVASVVTAGSLFTSITSHATPQLVVQANAALDALEDNLDGTTFLTSPKVKGTLEAYHTNGTSSNVVITVDGKLAAGTLGGNVPSAALTNALGPLTFSKTNTFFTYTAVDDTNAMTNTVIILKGLITSWTTNGVSI